MYEPDWCCINKTELSWCWLPDGISDDWPLTSNPEPQIIVYIKLECRKERADRRTDPLIHPGKRLPVSQQQHVPNHL